MRLIVVHLVTVLVTGTGCTLAAGLGDPKPLGADSPPGDGGLDDAGAIDLNVQAVSLSVGGAHACAVVQGAEGSPDNGTVRCWGANVGGELGIDSSATPFSRQPRPVEGRDGAKFGDVASLALGVDYSCGVTKDGYLFCWGAVPGESDNGVHRESNVPPFAPSQVDLRTSPFVGVTDVAAGTGGGCVLDADSLVCWGRGALELGTSLDAGVTNLDGGGAVVSDVGGASVGGAHACIIATRRGVRDVDCWGDNTYGQAGLPASADGVAFPSPVGLSDIGEVTQVAAGRWHSCALLTSGDVYCWGRNDRGQLGNSAVPGDSNVPVRVAFSTKAQAVALAIGDDHACAAMSDESVQCWGDDALGQLGFPSAAGYSAQPANAQRILSGSIGDLPRVKRIAAGGGTTCVIRWGDPQVWCWGQNDAGQAGQSPSASVPVATPVAW